MFNGSRLGKEFSANVFNDLFNGAGNKPDKEQSFMPFEKSHGQDGGSGTGGIFDLFSPGSPVADEIEEQALTRRMKKKRKQQRRI